MNARDVKKARLDVHSMKNIQLGLGKHVVFAVFRNVDLQPHRVYSRYCTGIYRTTWAFML